MLTVACAPKTTVAPSPPRSDVVVLLPDEETGTVGGAVVSNPSGAVSLDGERGAVRVVGDRAPVALGPMSEAQVDEIFGEALSALPRRSKRFTLHFRFDSDEITDESLALVPDILSAAQGYSAPEVFIVGHTDTSGAVEKNFELGLDRATTIRDLFVNAGLASSSITVISHGERDLLIRTPDETLEPRNRRVDVLIR